MSNHNYRNYINDIILEFKDNLNRNYQEIQYDFYILNIEFFNNPQIRGNSNKDILVNHKDGPILDYNKSFLILNKEIWLKIKNDFPNEKEIRKEGTFYKNKFMFKINDHIYYFYFLNYQKGIEEGYFIFEKFKEEANLIIPIFWESKINDFFIEMGIKDNYKEQNIVYKSILFRFKIKPHDQERAQNRFNKDMKDNLFIEKKYENSLKLYKFLYAYHLFENELDSIVNNKNCCSEKNYYLIDKEWIKLLKNICNYDKIKLNIQNFQREYFISIFAREFPIKLDIISSKPCSPKRKLIINDSYYYEDYYFIDEKALEILIKEFDINASFPLHKIIFLKGEIYIIIYDNKHFELNNKIGNERFLFSLNNNEILRELIDDFKTLDYERVFEDFNIIRNNKYEQRILKYKRVDVGKVWNIKIAKEKFMNYTPKPTQNYHYNNNINKNNEINLNERNEVNREHNKDINNNKNDFKFREQQNRNREKYRNNDYNNDYLIKMQINNNGNDNFKINKLDSNSFKNIKTPYYENTPNENKYITKKRNVDKDKDIDFNVQKIKKEKNSMIPEKANFDINRGAFDKMHLNENKGDNSIKNNLYNNYISVPNNGYRNEKFNENNDFSPKKNNNKKDIKTLYQTENSNKNIINNNINNRKQNNYLAMNNNINNNKKTKNYSLGKNQEVKYFLDDNINLKKINDIDFNDAAKLDKYKTSYGIKIQRNNNSVNKINIHVNKNNNNNENNIYGNKHNLNINNQISPLKQSKTEVKNQNNKSINRQNNFINNKQMIQKNNVNNVNIQTFNPSSNNINQNNNRNFVNNMNNNIGNNNNFNFMIRNNNEMNNKMNNLVNFNNNINFNNNFQNLRANNLNNFNFNNQMNFQQNNFLQMNQFEDPLIKRNHSFNPFVKKNNNIINQFNPNEKEGRRIHSLSPQNPPITFSIKKNHANGLENIGATCYMNATIQCLAHIEQLTRHLLKPKNLKNIESNKYKFKLTNSYVRVLNNLWLNNRISYYSPDDFKNVISKMNPLFAGIQANDSKDLILFLLETMHNELNTAKKTNIPSYNLNQYNYEKTFELFSKYFAENYLSVISNLFYGMYNSMMTCLNCNITTHNVQCYNILIFPLEEVRIFKGRNNNIVDIIECFEYYQKLDYMTGQNQIYCNNCHAMANSCNTSKIIISPNVLVINLNRGKGLQFDVKLTFKEYLDIRNFVYYKESPNYYELIGIVTHFGPSSMGGHFIAFCKSFVDYNWYKYNDAKVDISSFQEASTIGVPYILFYSLIKR